jgi:pyruvate-formate lyase-activating enzyme
VYRTRPKVKVQKSSASIQCACPILIEQYLLWCQLMIRRGAAQAFTSNSTANPRSASYVMNGRLYLSLTDYSNSKSLFETRGPGFSMPPSSAFTSLKDYEPTALELADLVDQHYENLEIVGMGENDKGVSFAGMGEPTQRLDLLLDVVNIVKERRHGVPFRLVSNGLCCPESATALFEAGVESASIALMSANPAEYEKIMSPSPKFSHADVCNFIVALSEAGIVTECTAVKIPGVNMRDVEQLGRALGAVNFRQREYFE